MSKSFDFCVKMASDKTRSGYADMDWTAAQEQDSRDIFRRYIGAATKVILSDKDGRELVLNLEYNEDGDFDYFTSTQLVHDGTLLFVAECFEKLVRKILYAETYFKPKGSHSFGDTVKYTIGNFVYLNEHGDDFGGEKWMKTRTTVLLPLKYEKIDGGDDV